jgi:excisionase family DNA binding protein
MSDQNTPIDRMLTTSEVAKILDVHINTVRRWSNQGSLASYRIGSRGDRRFRRSDVDNLLNGNIKKKYQNRDK